MCRGKRESESGKAKETKVSNVMFICLLGFFCSLFFFFFFSFLLMRLLVLLFLFILLRMDEEVGAKGKERVEGRGDKLVSTLIIGKLPTKSRRRVQKH